MIKKEVLVFNNFSLKINNAISLENISLILKEGECTSFPGLASSGKNELIKVLNGEFPFKEGQIKIDNQVINSQEQIKEKIHKISEINYTISDWTVAEYTGMVSKHITPWFFEKKKINREIQSLFRDLGLSIDVNRKLKDLSEVEKRLIDLVKAYRKGSRILIIEDEFTGFTNSELIFLKETLKRIIKDRMTVVIAANANNINQVLSDNYVILRKGRIIKKCRRNKIENAEQLERILLETSHNIPGKRINLKEDTFEIEREISYSIENLKIEDSIRTGLSFEKGKVTTILTLNRKEKQRLFDILSGRVTDKSVILKINNRILSETNISGFVRNKIASIDQPGSPNELLPEMSIGENILMPSLHKISHITYLKDGRKIGTMLERQIFENEKEYNFYEDSERSLQNIFTVFERWYVFKPAILILLEPFYQSDIYGASIIKNYINKFIEEGTTIIILKARETDIRDISHRIVRL